MPVDLATARNYYNSLSSKPTPQPGRPFDEWVLDWFTNGVNKGDPKLVAAAGGTQTYQGEGWEATGGALRAGGNTADWQGERNPTPSELRAYSREAGWSEDFERFDDRQLAKWINESWDVGSSMFRGGFEKPTDDPASLRGGGGGGGGRGGGGGGGGNLAQQVQQAPAPQAATPAAPGPGGTFAGAPAYSYPEFVPPTYEEATADPGYQFALGEGRRALEGSAAARGTLRTGGTLRDLIDYGQQAGAQQYQNVWDRSANEYGLNRQTSQDVFAPQYGSWQSQFGAGENRWQTQFGGDLARWQTGQGTDLARWQTGQGADLSKWQARYGGGLSRDLQREQNIYGLLSQPPPSYGY